jgi:hypothetical protein
VHEESRLLGLACLLHPHKTAALGKPTFPDLVLARPIADNNNADQAPYAMSSEIASLLLQITTLSPYSDKTFKEYG